MNNREVYKPVKSEPRLFYGYIVVAAAFLILMLMFGIFMAFGVFFKPLLTEFGWTRAITSSALSINWIVQAFLTIVMGRVNDRFGPRVVLTFCGFIFGLGYLLTSQLSTLWQLYLLYGVLIATGLSGAFVPLASTVARWFVRRRGIMTGIVLSGVGIGGLVTPPLANWLISVYDWRVSNIILGSVALVIIVLLAQLLRRDPTKMGQRPYGEHEENTELEWGTESFTIKEAASTTQFWLVTIVLLCFGFCMSAIFIHVVPHVTDLGFSASSAANILATSAGVSIIGRVLLGNIGDKFGNRRVLVIAVILLEAALLLLMPVTEEWGLYLFAIIFGLAYGSIAALQSPLIAELFGLRAHGLILGVVNFGYCIGAAVGPFVVGYIFDLTDSYRLAFLLCAAIAVIGIILASVLRPTKKLGRESSLEEKNERAERLQWTNSSQSET